METGGLDERACSLVLDEMVLDEMVLDEIRSGHQRDNFTQARVSGRARRNSGDGRSGDGRRVPACAQLQAGARRSRSVCRWAVDWYWGDRAPGAAALVALPINTTV